MALLSKNKKKRETRTSPRERIPLKTYYRSANGPGSISPFKKKPTYSRTKNLFYVFVNIALIVMLICGLCYSLLISSKPRLVISSRAYHDIKDYQLEAEKLFSTLKNRNKITFDQDDITSKMKKQFPEIESINTELPVFSQIATLRINIARPSLVLKSNSASYVVDSQGMIVQKIGSTFLTKKLPLVEDKSGYEAKIGKAALNAEAVGFITSLDAQLRSSGVDMSGYTLPPVAQEIDLYVKDQKYFVKFYLAGDVLTQVGQYLAARSHFTTSASPAQYLDVRVPGKIFYK